MNLANSYVLRTIKLIDAKVSNLKPQTTKKQLTVSFSATTGRPISKSHWIKRNLVEKDLGKKKIWSEKIFGRKNFLEKKNFG